MTLCVVALSTLCLSVADFKTGRVRNRELIVAVLVSWIAASLEVFLGTLNVTTLLWSEQVALFAVLLLAIWQLEILGGADVKLLVFTGFLLADVLLPALVGALLLCASFGIVYWAIGGRGKARIQPGQNFDSMTLPFLPFWATSLTLAVLFNACGFYITACVRPF